MTTALRISYPNVGNSNVEYIHCPNCTKAFPSKDVDGKSETIPARCKRCDCPMDDGMGPRAQRWMNDQARIAHDPALAAMGRQIRGQQAPSASPNQEAIIVPLTEGQDGETGASG